MTARAKGILAILASAFGFALMAAFVRLCDDYGGPVSSFQKSLFRNLVALVIAGVVLARGEGGMKAAFPRLPGKAWMLVLTRSVAGCIGIFGNFYALSRIPVGEAMALNKTAPIFAVALSWVFLRERVRLHQALCLVAAFAGVLLVMKPGFRGADTFATLCALTGGLGAGIAYTCVRELGVMRVDGSFIVFFFSAFSCVASLPFMAAGVDPMTWRQFLIMLGAGCGAAIGQFGVTAAYRFAPPREVAVYDYSNVVFTAALGYLFFSQTPDFLSVVGFLMIAFSALRAAH